MPKGGERPVASGERPAASGQPLAVRPPLVRPSAFVIDTDAAESLLREIQMIAKSAGNEMAGPVQAILDGMDSGNIKPKSLFSNLLEGNDSFFETLAKELGIKKETVAFAAYNSVQPSLSLYAETISIHLDPSESWEKGYCPICGSPPALSTLEDEGKRALFCCFCWHKWPVPRMFCPFCEDRKEKSLRYFHPPLEQVATLHWDMRATEMGFENGARGKGRQGILNMNYKLDESPPASAGR